MHVLAENILMWWEFTSMLSCVQQQTINIKYLTSLKKYQRFCAINAWISNDLMTDVFLVHKPILLKLQFSILKAISEYSSFGITAINFVESNLQMTSYSCFIK